MRTQPPSILIEFLLSWSRQYHTVNSLLKNVLLDNDELRNISHVIYAVNHQTEFYFFVGTEVNRFQPRFVLQV